MGIIGSSYDDTTTLQLYTYTSRKQTDELVDRILSDGDDHDDDDDEEEETEDCTVCSSDVSRVLRLSSSKSSKEYDGVVTD